MDFERAFEKLCELEGFKSAVQRDLGGLTIWGISERYYPDDVRKISTWTAEEAKEYAKEFYRKRFWEPIAHLPFPINIVAFLMGVNAPGPVKHATSKYDDYRDILLHMCQYYSKLVAENPDISRFFRGWINRVINVWQFVNTLLQEQK